MNALLVSLVAFALTLVGMPFVQRIATRTGMVAEPSTVRYHSRPTPLLGGLAIYAGVTVTLWLMVDKALAPQLVGILGGASLVAVIGMVDDRRPISPSGKILVETLAGLLLIAGGIHVDILAGPSLPILETSLGDTLLTLLWILAVTNAANLLDHMDGILGGVAAIASASFMLLAIGSGQEIVAPLSGALLGATLGFLRYNFNPAAIFMGDGGSLFLGFVLAALGIKLKFPDAPTLETWMLPIIVLAVPLFDTNLVILSRLRRGVNPLTTGGKDHLAHRLVARGASDREAALNVWILAFAAGGLALLAREIGSPGAYIILCLVLACGILGIWHLELAPTAIRNLPESKRSSD